MEIILKEDIIGLGFKNDIVNVKSGYGRNYLIPTGKGVIYGQGRNRLRVCQEAARRDSAPAGQQACRHQG